MKKIFLVILLVIFVSGGKSFGQTFDWNLRGGFNLMNSHTSGKDVALWYHYGAQLGVRIASYGFYGEALYSMHENQDEGGDPLAYFVPSIIAKGFWRKYLFVEFGGSFLTLIDDSDLIENTFNPDNLFLLSAGLGLQFSKIQISFRSTAKQSYGLFQGTIAMKF